MANANNTATVLRGYWFNSINAGAGETVRIAGTLTIYGDPAGVDVDDSMMTSTVIQTAAPTPVAIVPEPALLVLVVCGTLGGLIVVHRRRNA